MAAGDSANTDSQCGYGVPGNPPGKFPAGDGDRQAGDYQTQFCNHRISHGGKLANWLVVWFGWTCLFLVGFSRCIPDHHLDHPKTDRSLPRRVLQGTEAPRLRNWIHGTGRVAGSEANPCRLRSRGTSWRLSRIGSRLLLFLLPPLQQGDVRGSQANTETIVRWRA